jgi:hypothetical protein
MLYTREVTCIQRMDCAADNVAIHVGNENLKCATALKVNSDTANTRKPRRWIAFNEITAKDG